MFVCVCLRVCVGFVTAWVREECFSLIEEVIITTKRNSKYLTALPILQTKMSSFYVLMDIKANRKTFLAKRRNRTAIFDLFFFPYFTNHLKGAQWKLNTLNACISYLYFHILIYTVPDCLFVFMYFTKPLKGHGDGKKIRWEGKLCFNVFTFSPKPFALHLCSQKLSCPTETLHSFVKIAFKYTFLPYSPVFFSISLSP